MNVGKIGPSFLLSLRSNPLNFTPAIGELIDNSFDAGANQIRLRFLPRKELHVIDDGAGCDNIEKMLTLGEHYRQSTTKLGRYGVGLKEAACWLWGELLIVSRCRSKEYRCAIDWDRVSKQSTWEVDDPVVIDYSGPSGTELKFRNVTRECKDYEKLRDDLGYTFAPALWNGRQILMEFPRKPPVACQGWQLPELTDLVQDRFEVNGKRVRLRAGIVDVGLVNSRSGFSYCHGHRIILNSSLGSNGMSTTRICGIVELDSAWMLSKNKTELVDSDQDGLEHAIYERCKDILTKASTQAELIRNSALESQVTDAMRSMLTELRKEKRDRGEQEGAIEPKQTGRKRMRAKNCQPGDKFLRKCNVGQVRMEWESRNDNELGRVDIHGNVIYLNSEHKRLKFHKERQNADALVDNCMALFVAAIMESEQSGRFAFMRDTAGFVESYSKLLQSQQQESQEAVAV